MEGEGFRDRIQEFNQKNAAILGASFDTQEENRAFREKFSYPFPLLCDTSRKLGMAYGACDTADAGHASRITVVIAGDATVARVYGQVDAKSHPAQVLADL